MTVRSRQSDFCRGLLLAFLCAALTALRHDCHAFAPPRSVGSGAGTRSMGPGLGWDDEARRDDATAGRLFGSAADRPDIAVLRSREDYIEFLERDERLCVIKFYANWCKSCQRFGVKFRHLALDEGDRLDRKGAVVRLGEVRFAEVEFTAAATLCRSLNIKKLPTVHMHRRGEQVVDMVCKPSLFHLVVDEVHGLLEGVELPPVVTPEREAAFTVGRNGNVTGTSFDELGDEIMASLREEKEKATPKKEKSSWFPF